jgi:hypothetical protein
MAKFMSMTRVGSKEAVLINQDHIIKVEASTQGGSTVYLTEVSGGTTVTEVVIETIDVLERFLGG